MRHHQRLFFGATGLMAASLTLATLGMGASPAWASGHGSGNGGNGSNQPPGNNGTVKVDEYTVDSGQDNDPHVACGFTVSFYGYDGTQTQYATINVTPVAPTSGGSSFTTQTSWTVPSRTSGDQLDRQVEISGGELAPHLSGVTPQANQGYHLRLEVEVTGSQGSDDKYKVFWMQPCSSQTSGSYASASSSNHSSSGVTGQSSGAATGSSGGAGPAGPAGSPAGPAGSTPSPAGSTAGITSGSAMVPNAAAPVVVRPSLAASSSRPAASTVAGTGATDTAPPASAETDSAAAPAESSVPFGVLSGDQSAAPSNSAAPLSGGSLAFTGASIGILVALGLGLIAAGLLLTRRWRRVGA